MTLKYTSLAAAVVLFGSSIVAEAKDQFVCFVTGSEKHPYAVSIDEKAVTVSSERGSFTSSIVKSSKGKNGVIVEVKRKPSEPRRVFDMNASIVRIYFGDNTDADQIDTCMKQSEFKKLHQ